MLASPKAPTQAGHQHGSSLWLDWLSPLLVAIMCLWPAQGGASVSPALTVFHSPSAPGYTKLPFKWFDYLREMGSVAAPVKLFNKVSLFLPLQLA